MLGTQPKLDTWRDERRIKRHRAAVQVLDDIRKQLDIWQREVELKGIGTGEFANSGADPEPRIDKIIEILSDAEMIELESYL